MRRMALPFVLMAVVFLVPAHVAGAGEQPKKAAIEKPPERVVVMYFHRTERCPTCRRMGSYAEEAVVKGFAEQVKDHKVEFYYVDFQDKKNAALRKGYKIAGPTLVVAKVAKDKVVEAKKLEKIWTKVRDKEAFVKYVRKNVAALRKPLPKTARKSRAGVSGQQTK